MASYIVHNRSANNISLDIRPSPGKKHGHSLCIGPGEALDILPYAGTIERCRLIAQLHNLETLNIVEIRCHQ